MLHLRYIFAASVFFTAIAGFSATGTIETKIATNRENTLDITIEGEAAKEISAQLSKNGIQGVREGFSGTLVQAGKGIRCISEDGDRPVYCYIAIVGDEIK